MVPKKDGGKYVVLQCTTNASTKKCRNILLWKMWTNLIFYIAIQSCCIHIQSTTVHIYLCTTINVYKHHRCTTQHCTKVQYTQMGHSALELTICYVCSYILHSITFRNLTDVPKRFTPMYRCTTQMCQAWVRSASSQMHPSLSPTYIHKSYYGVHLYHNNHRGHFIVMHHNKVSSTMALYLPGITRHFALNSFNCYRSALCSSRQINIF